MQKVGAAADAIADIAEQHGADGAHEKAGGEGTEGGQQPGLVIADREIEIADGPREIAVDREVVPLHHIAGDAGGNDLAAREIGFRERHEDWPPDLSRLPNGSRAKLALPAASLQPSAIYRARARNSTSQRVNAGRATS